TVDIPVTRVDVAHASKCHCLVSCCYASEPGGGPCICGTGPGNRDGRPIAPCGLWAICGPCGTPGGEPGIPPPPSCCAISCMPPPPPGADEPPDWSICRAIAASSYLPCSSSHLMSRMFL